MRDRACKITDRFCICESDEDRCQQSRFNCSTPITAMRSCPPRPPCKCLPFSYGTRRTSVPAATQIQSKAALTSQHAASKAALPWHYGNGRDKGAGCTEQVPISRKISMLMSSQWVRSNVYNDDADGLGGRPQIVLSKACMLSAAGLNFASCLLASSSNDIVHKYTYRLTSQITATSFTTGSHHCSFSHVG